MTIKEKIEKTKKEIEKTNKDIEIAERNSNVNLSMYLTGYKIALYDLYNTLTYIDYGIIKK